MSPGDPDPTFGSGGVATPPLSEPGDPETIGQALLVDPDGRIVLAGTADGDSRGDVGVVRWLPYGSLDGQFDGDGKVQTDLGAHESAAAVVRDPAGRLVAAGWVQFDTPGLSFRCLLVRYLPDGHLDPDFAAGGVLLDALGHDDAALDDVLVQPDGKYVALGTGHGVPSTLFLAASGPAACSIRPSAPGGSATWTWGRGGLRRFASCAARTVASSRS